MITNLPLAYYYDGSSLAYHTPSLTVKFAKLHPDAVIPSYSKPGDNGLDLTAISYSYEGKYHNYEFGLAVEIPVGYVGLIFPRSSISNTDLVLSNSVGVIDSSYRGPLSARFKGLRNSPVLDGYDVGDRVAQLVILPCPKITVFESTPEALSKTSRGSDAYGSSGR